MLARNSFHLLIVAHFVVVELLRDGLKYCILTLFESSIEFFFNFSGGGVDTEALW